MLNPLGLDRPQRRGAVDRLLIFLLRGLVLAVGLAGCDGLGEQNPRGITVTPEIQNELKLGNYRALLIGINDYQHWQSLQFAERDARELRDLLVGEYGFPSGNVTLLLGSDATESRIVTTLHGFLKNATAEDNLLIYYSGHGNLDPLTETGFWIPQDGRLADESSWVPFTSVRTLLVASRLEARSVVLITDSCYGGSITRSGPTPGMGTPDDWQSYQAGLLKLVGKKSRQVIASGGFETVPDKSDFAAALRKALETNQYPLVDLEFLFYYQIYPVMRLASSQKPLMERLTTGVDLDGQFILRRVGSELDAEKVFWDSIRDAEDPELFKEYLRQWPEGAQAEQAKLRIEQLEGQPAGGEPRGESGEVAFWNSIRDKNDADLFEEYLSRWPDGTFALIARKELERLRQPAVVLAKVPRLIGGDVKMAGETLAAANLKLGAVSRKESGRPAGTILEQRPEAGAEVAAGSEVQLSISVGGLQVPNVVGMDLRTASRNLIRAGLETEVLRWQVKGKPGVVLAQLPAPDAFAEKGAAVYLTVSGVEVPSVVGLDLEAARTELRKLGLAAEGGVTGPVVGQDPAASMAVAPGAKVTLRTKRSLVLTPVARPGAADVLARRELVAALPAPALSSPANGAEFNHFPRKTKLVWRPVPNAAAYGLEVEFKSRDWTPWIDFPKLKETSHEFAFVGAQPGRWRVWAIDGQGRAGTKSEWREFRFLR